MTHFIRGLTNCGIERPSPSSAENSVPEEPSEEILPGVILANAGVFEGHLEPE